MIDTAFEFHSDTPSGKDADAHSPTLRRYHQLLWSKPLPNGDPFTLTPEPRGYLSHRSGRGTFFLSSDAITTNLLGRAWRVIQRIAPDDRPENLGYTIGSAVVFPGDKIDGKATINGARGFHPRIADRFDLTLECIRRHYAGGTSPLTDALLRYARFFDLFETFDAYTEFFLLDDLVHAESRQVAFMHPFDDFRTPAVPRTVDEYLAYVRSSNEFIRARNRRIENYVAGTS
ncbi:DUF6994 family protein [Serinibacter arcticus]|uniref:DUF6994 family protein n=1 Tax=Serinibacter arcticus TaxID=1655435 RepID=UPI001F348698|nr:hypothetical protein [Serinibacter arcticus]